MFILNLFRGSKNAVTYEPGHVIFAKGDSGDSMYVILEGEVEIQVQDKVIDTAGPGAILGEMALVDKSPRTPPPLPRRPARSFPSTKGSSTSWSRRRPTLP